MDSKGTGITLGLGLLVAFIGYILWQVTIGFNTASDDIATILTNSADGSAILQISTILISVCLLYTSPRTRDATLSPMPSYA